MVEEKERVLAELAAAPADQNAFADAVIFLAAERDWESLILVYRQFAAARDHSERAAVMRGAIDTLEGLLGEAGDPPARSAMLVEIGNIWSHDLGRVDQALLNYQAAFKVDPRNDASMTRVREIHADQGNWALVRRLYKVQLQVDRPPAEKAALLVEFGQLMRDRFGDLDAARGHFDDALALDPNYIAATEALAGLASRPWQHELARLSALLESAEGADRAAALFQYADVLGSDSPEEHEDPAPLVEEGLALDPDSPEGLAVAAKLRLSQGDHVGHDDLLEALVSGERASGEQRVSAWSELARTRLEREDAEGAERALRAALAVAPSDAGALELAGPIFEARGDTAGLVEVLEAAVAHQPHGAAPVELHLALARAYWQGLSDEEQAERHFRRVRLADSRNREMLDFYLAHHRGREDWRRVLSTLQTIREAAEPTERVGIAAEMARVAEKELGDLIRSVDIWTWVRKQDPANTQARAELRRLLSSAAKWNRLLDLIKEEIAAQPEDAVDEMISLYLEMISILQEHFDLPVLVGNAYTAILELDPAHPAASDALMVRYETAERWADLVALLERCADATLDAAERAEYLKRSGILWRDRLESPRRAVEAFERSNEAAPDPGVVDSLRELYRANDDPAASLRVMRAGLPSMSPEKQVQTLREMVDIASDRLKQPALVLELTADLFAASQGEDEESARFLLEQYRADGREGAVESVLRARVEAGVDDPAVLRELAGLSGSRPDGADEAIALWNRLLDNDAESADVVEKLGALHARTERWDELVALADAHDCWDLAWDLMDDTAREGRNVQVFRRMASIAAERFEDTARQTHALERALEIVPDDLEIAAALEPLYAASERHAERARVLEILLGSESPDRVQTIRKELVALHDGPLQDPNNAFDWAVLACESDPGDEELRERGTELAEATGQQEAWFAALKRGAAAMPASPARLEIYRALARIADALQRSSADAIDLWERVRAEAPADQEALDRLVGLYERDGDLEALGERLNLAIDHAQDDAQREALAFRLVTLEVLGGRVEGAYARLRALAGGEPDDAERLRALRETLEDAGAWEEVVDTAEAELSRAEGDARQWALLASGRARLFNLDQISAGLDRYADVLDEGASTPAGAAAADDLLVWLDSGREPERVLDLLEPALRATERWNDVVTVLDARVGTVDPAAAIELLREISRLATTRIDESERAFRATLDLMEIGPSASADWERAEELARGLDSLGELASVWEKVLEVGEPGTVDGLARRLARVLEEDLDRPADARGIWDSVRAEDPGDPDAAAALERLHRSLGDADGLADVLVERAARAAGEEATALLREAATIYGERLGDPERAAELYEAALEHSPADLEAFAGLESTYRRTGDQEALIGVVRRKIAAYQDEPGVAADALTVLGEAIVEAHGDLRAAAHAFRRALEADAGYASALRCLEALLDEPGVHEEEGLADQIALTLRVAYDARSDLEGLIGFCERRLERTDDPEERRKLHLATATVLERSAEDDDRAFEHLRAALAIEPGAVESVDRFEVLALRLERWEDLAMGLESVVDVGVEDAARLAHIRHRLAEIYTDRLGEPEEAERHLEAAIIDDGSDRVAMERLEALLRDHGSTEDLAAVLSWKAASGIEAADAAAALREASALLREVDPERAADCAIEAYAVDPSSEEVAADAEVLLTELERWEDVASLLLLRADRAEGDAVAEYRRRWAEVLEERVRDRPRAAAAYRTVLDVRADDPVALARLDHLYGLLVMPKEHIEVLEQRLEAAAGADQLALRCRLARTLHEQLARSDTALEQLEQVLATDPSSREALGLLEGMMHEPAPPRRAFDLLLSSYEQRNAWDAAARLLAGAADRASGNERVALLDRARKIHEEELRDPGVAFALALEAYRSTGGEEERRREVHRLAAAVDGWAALEHCLEELIEACGSGPERKALILDASRILADHLGRPDDAVLRLHDVLAADPANVDVLRALDEAYVHATETGQHAAVVDALVDMTETEDERIALLRRSAALHEADIGDIDGAIDRYRAVLASDGEDEESRERLRVLLRRREDWPALAAHLAQMAASAADEASYVAWMLELAALRDEQLGDPLGAISDLGQVLERDPSNERVRRLAEALAGRHGDDEAVFAAVAPWTLAELEERGDWHGVAETLERLSRFGDAESRASHLQNLAAAYEERLGDRERALSAWGRLLELNPENDGARTRARALAHAQMAWEIYSEILGAAARAAEDRTLQASYWEELAGIEDLELGRSAEAIVAWTRCASHDAARDRALLALGRLLHRVGDLDGLARLYGEAAEQTEGERAVTLARKSAAVHVHLRHDPGAGVSVLRDALDRWPDDAGLRRSLALMLRAAGRWDELADLLRANARGAEDADERVRSLAELADVESRELSDTAAAAESYTRLLDDEKWGEVARDRLVDLLRASRREGEASPVALQVAETLEPVLREQRRWTALADVLQIRVLAAAEPDQTRARLVELGALYADLARRPRPAFDAFQRALLLAPDDEEIAERLRSAAGAVGEPGLLREALEHVGRHHLDSPAGVRLLVEAGQLAESEGRYADAARALRAVVDRDPSHVPAADTLQRVLRASGDQPVLIVMIRERIGETDDPEERATLRHQLADLLAEDGAELSEIREVYEELIAERPTDASALDALERVTREQEDWERLASVLASHAAVAVDAAERQALFAGLGAVRRRRLGDLAGAAEAYRRAADMDPDDVTALTELVDVESERGQWPAAVDALDTLASRAEAPTLRNEFAFRAARIVIDALGDRVAGVSRLAAVVSEDPDYEPAVSLLGELVSEEDSAEAAATALERVWRARGRSGERLEALEVVLRHAEDPEVRFRTLTSMATIAKQETDDPEAAFNLLSAALELRPDDATTLYALRETAEDLDDIPRLADVLDRISESDTGAVAAVFLLRLVGDLYRTRLNDPVQAARRYQALLTLAPEDESARKALATVLEASGNWDALADELDRSLRNGDGTPVSSTANRLAAIKADHLGDTEAAIGLFAEVLTAKPGDREALSGLEALVDDQRATSRAFDILEQGLEKIGAWARLAAVLERRAADAEGDAARSAILARLAAIELQHLDDADSAFERWLAAFATDPADAGILDELVALATDATRAERLIDAIEEAVGLIDEPTLQGERLVCAALLADEKLGDAERAEGLLHDAVRADPDAVEPLTRSVALLEAEERYDEAFALVSETATTANDPVRRAELHRWRARIAEHGLGVPSLAEVCFTDALSLEPDDVDVLQQLVRLATAREAWVDVVDLLDRVAGSATASSVQVQARREIAQLTREHLDDPDRAIAACRDLLELAPEDPGALAVLADLLEEAENWHELLDVLLRQLALGPLPAEARRIRLEIATLYRERFDDDDEALAMLQEVLRSDPDDRDAKHELREILVASERWPDLVAFLRGELGGGDVDPVETHLQIADLAESRLSDASLAESHLSAALAAAPTLAAPVLAFSQFLHSAGRVDEAIALLSESRERFSDPVERAQVLFAAGRLADDANDPASALVSYEAAFEDDPGVAGLLDVLEGRYRSSENWSGVQNILYIGAERADTDLAVERWLRLADLAERHLDDTELARAGLVRAHETAGVRPDVTPRLVTVLIADGDFAEAIRIGEAARENAGPAGLSGCLSDLCSSLGVAYENRGDDDLAVERYHEAVAAQNDHVGALLALGALHLRHSRSEQSLKAYQSALIHQVNIRDRAAKLRLFHDLGLIRMEAGDIDKARDMFERALLVEPDHQPSIDAVERLDEG